VSGDNAYAEALLRTAKYRPALPASGFADLEAARIWGVACVPPMCDNEQSDARR
jgi:hypothetical protein